MSKQYFEISSQKSSSIAFAGLNVNATTQQGVVVVSYQLTYHNQNKNKITYLEDGNLPAVMRSFTLMPSDEFVELGLNKFLPGFRKFKERGEIDSESSDLKLIEHAMKTQLTLIKDSIQLVA